MTHAPTPLELEREAAIRRDQHDPAASLRERFHLPTGADGRPKAYLAGQSLGAQPRAARAAVDERLDAWARLGVDGWFDPARPWIDVERELADATGRLVGAAPAEVTTANTLSIDLHLLLAAFFRPSGARRRILIDAPTFPSDRYVVESQDCAITVSIRRVTCSSSDRDRARTPSDRRTSTRRSTAIATSSP